MNNPDKSNNNSQLIHNDANKSIFAYQNPIKGTQKVGSISVTDIELALPDDTFKTKRQAYYELKPTTHRLASQIKVHDMSCAVPIRNIWKYFPEFIAKGDSLVKTGSANVPDIQASEDAVTTHLPWTTPVSIIGKMLACYSNTAPGAVPTNLNCHLLFARAGVSPTYAGRRIYNGNVMDWRYEGVNGTGGASPNQGSLLQLPWWAPRLIKQGILNGCNYNAYSSNGVTYGMTTIIDDKSAMLARYCMTLMQLQWPNAVWANCNSSNAQGLKLVHYHDATEGLIYFCVCCVGPNEQAFSLAPEFVDLSAFKASALFTVSTYGSGKNYGDITILGQQEALPTPSGTIENYVVKFGVLAAADYGFCAAGFSAIISAMFNRSEFFGYGSLMESMGHHLFQEIRVIDAVTTYTGWSTAALSQAYIPALLSEQTWSLLSPDILAYILDRTKPVPKFCILPYFAYQRICSERFLLPHNILSNNPDQNGVVDTGAQYDSPYWRNNMVPTCYFGKDNSDVDALDQYGLYMIKDENGDYQWRRPNNSAITEADWHYCMAGSQLLLIFLDRGYIQQLDAMTEIWQKQDQNVKNLIQSASIGSVDSIGAINAKAFLEAKRLGKFLWFGGTDQTYEQNVENQFGVRDVPTDCIHFEVLAKNQQTLAVQEVLNTGGAVDDNGDNRPLGDRVSICSNSIDKHYQYNAHMPEYSYILTLQWFSVRTEREQTPRPATNAFDRLLQAVNPRDAFQKAFYSVYQVLGDDALDLGDVRSFADRSIRVGWTNKNNWLKSGFSEYRGEWRTKFRRMLITPHPNYRKQLYEVGLNYGYLMPAPFEYDLHLVDRFGDSMMYDIENETYKKTTMTATDLVGLEF